MPTMNLIQAIRSGLEVMLERDPNVCVMGEDVGYFGGVFRATQGLQDRFGSRRVFDTPLAEGGIIAAAIGMGLNGLRPVPEIQFCRLHVPGVRPDHQRARQAALPQRRRMDGAAHDPHSLRRRHSRRNVSQPVARSVLHAHCRPVRRDAVESVRRQGALDQQHRDATIR